MIYFKEEKDIKVNTEVLFKLCKIAEPENLEARIWNINWKRKIDIRELVSEALKSSNFNFPEIKQILIGRIQPRDRSPIHIDQALNTEREHNEVVFNIPLTPTADANLSWYIPKKWSGYQESFASYKNPHTVRIYPEEDCRLVSSIKLLAPFYARTDVPHSLINNSDEAIYAMSLRFYKNPDVGILRDDQML